MTTESSATDVSVLGTGAVGTRIVEVLLAAGRSVTAWNRTPSKAAPLAAHGAQVTESPGDAAAASPLVLLPLTGYDAVLGTLDTIAARIAGRTVVPLTTGAPDEARRASARAHDAGAVYLDGALRTAPDVLGTAEAALLFSGPAEAFASHRSTLEQLGTARHVGADPAAAAIQDLALFGLWYDAQAGLLRALDTARAAGVDLEAFAPLAAQQVGYVMSSAADTASEVSMRTYPSGPADLHEHAALLGQLVGLREGNRLGDGGLSHLHRLVLDRAQRGDGPEGLTAVLD